MQKYAKVMFHNCTLWSLTIGRWADSFGRWRMVCCMWIDFFFPFAPVDVFLLLSSLCVHTHLLYPHCCLLCRLVPSTAYFFCCCVSVSYQWTMRWQHVDIKLQCGVSFLSHLWKFFFCRPVFGFIPIFRTHIVVCFAAWYQSLFTFFVVVFLFHTGEQLTVYFFCCCVSVSYRWTTPWQHVDIKLQCGLF